MRKELDYFLPLRINCSENSNDLLDGLVKMSVLFCILFLDTVEGWICFFEKKTPASGWLTWVEVLAFKVGLQCLALWVHYSYEKVLFYKFVEIFTFIHYKIFTVSINKTGIGFGFFFSVCQALERICWVFLSLDWINLTFWKWLLPDTFLEMKCGQQEY